MTTQPVEEGVVLGVEAEHVIVPGSVYGFAVEAETRSTRSVDFLND